MERRGKVVKLVKKAEATLAVGLHAGTIERRAGDRLRVRIGGVLITCGVAPEVDNRLVDECARDRRIVLVTVRDDGMDVIGAVQTAPSAVRTEGEIQRISGKQVEIGAEDGVVIRVGASSLRLDKKGTIKIVGQKMTMDVAALVRVLSALVELP